MLHRAFPLVLLLLLAGAEGHARADDEEDALGGRYRITVGAEERRGDWRAWVETRSDRWTRALRVWTHLLRQGPGEAAPTALLMDPKASEVDFRLHEQGWVVATAGEGVRVFAPDAATRPGLEGRQATAGTLRPDLHVTPPCRFLADGYLSVGMQPAGSPHPRIQMLWVPLTAKGLGVGIPVVELPTPVDALLLADLQVRVDEEPGAWIVTWMAPVAGAPVHGRARIDRRTHDVRPLPPPEGPPTVRVAAVQCPSVLGDVAGNRRRLTALVTDAARAGAKVVVLPETAVTGYLSQDLKTTWHVPGRPRAPQFPEGRHPSTAAEGVPGTSLWHFAGLARRLGIWLTVPLLEEDRSEREPRYFNTVCLVSPQGRLAAHYRKTNPWPHPEQSWATTGDKGLATFDTPYGRVGLAICFDVHTVLAPYATKGLWALLYPIAWVSENDAQDVEWFGRDLPRRVKEAGFHLVGANWSVDAPQPWTGHGHSLVVAKDGTVLASAKTRIGPELVLADLPLAR